MIRRLLYLLLVALFVVRVDVWWWHEPALFWGLPIGLSYHLIYCLLMSVVLALLVRYAAPAALEDEP